MNTRQGSAAPTPSGLLGPLVPAGCVVRELGITQAPPDYLTAAERALVARAVAKRRREFTAGRACAKDALEELGHGRPEVLSGPRGEPLWPEGVVGSISHCPGHAAAVVADSRRTLALGIDLETARPLADDLVAEVVHGEETDAIGRLTARDPAVPWTRLLFSAKESVYKAWYPLRHDALEADDVQVRLGLDGTFRAQVLRRPAAPFPVTTGGRWARGHGIVATVLVVPRGA